MDYGFEAIIAPSFGDIFRNNSSKQGLVIVQLALHDVDELSAMVKEDPTRLVVVDVQRLSVEVPETGWQRDFVLDPMTQERLLEGWDDIGLTLRRAPEIDKFETTSPASRMTDIFDAQGHALHDA
jgi:3-isopropylmalate/(R)-2-methylmalate dehydratase small subunit